MKWLIILTTVLIASVLLALLAAQEPGYVLIIYQGWKIETSLTLLVVTFIISLVAAYYAVRSLSGVMGVPSRLGIWRRHKQAIRAEESLNRGMTSLFEGEWKQAERQLIKQVKLSHSPQLNYLAAARAAQEQGAFERRDDYLNKAARIEGSSKVVVGLTQANLQLEHKQYEQALASLESLYQTAPKHPFVLRLLAKMYRQLGDWQRLEDLFPALKRQKIYSESELKELQHDCYSQLLVQYSEKYDYNTLQQLWRRIPKPMHQDMDIIQHYAELLINIDIQDEAEKLLRTTLQKQWSNELLPLYGRVKASNGQAQLAQAERWLHAHGDDPQLLLVLGRICINNQLWGKAKEYLQKATDLGQHEALSILAGVLERLGENALAQEYYRKGVKLLT